ncbi:ribosomal RNA processing protein 1 homolog [Anoplophora glabripennis]|nr:ribosomal RNA processing protein 1 homolog [Anoplophora glabripennis]
MAVREQSGDRPREKNMKTDKKVYLVAQELELARVLAGNSTPSRDRALRNLKKWFSHRSKTLPFTDQDFQIIWKGLYYSMWMSDKPLTQEECAENIASLIHFQTFDEPIRFFKAGLSTLINQWFGIDQLRLDKFLMLVRRLLRHMLIVLKEHGLSKKNIDMFSEVVLLTVLNTNINPPVGLFMHFTEIFLEEIAKITEGNIPSDRLVDFIRPFIKKLAVTSDGREIAHIRKFIFIYLIKQSNLGMDYQAKYEAWKREGFPGNINSMQKIKLDDDEKASEGVNLENKEKPLDPRAGRVDVELPQIKFNAKHFVNALQEYKFDKDSNSKSRSTINELTKLFTKLSKGMYPLGTKQVRDTKTDSYDTSIRKATNRLVKFEKKLLGKEKKKRKSSGDHEETDEVPRKRKKVDKDTIDGKELEKFIGQNLSKKTKKRKKSDDRNVNGKAEHNGDDVTEEELENFIVQSEGDLEKKTKKNKKLKISINSDKVTEELENSAKQNGGTKKTRKNKKIAENETKNTEEVKVVDEKENKLKRKRRNETNTDKTEAKKKRKKKNGTREQIIDNIECVFERNSGTWVVYDVSRDTGEIEATTAQETGTYEGSVESSTDIKECPSTSSRNPENSESALPSDKSPSTFGTDLGSPNDENQTPSKNKASSSKSPIVEKDSPKSGINPVRLFESPQKTNDLFPKSSWDEPLHEGEYEICIPSKKHVAKLKRRAKKTNQSVHELINTSMKQIRGKGRLSLDVSLVQNPFSAPNSAKKVKINTKLNKSQEIHEHVQQILSSPGIPYDANKKPLKPLLKAAASSTPVNPFYNKQLNVC